MRESNDLISGTMNNSITDLIFLKNLNLFGKPPKAPRVIEFHWSFPPSSWLKINTDGFLLVLQVQLDVLLYFVLLEDL